MYIMRLIRLLLVIVPSIVIAHQIPLIIHMDVNKTIIAQDIGNNKGLDDVLIECIAKNCVGKWSTAVPEMTYVQYVKEYLVPGEKSNREVRKKRNDLIHAFFDFLKIREDVRYTKLKEQCDQLKNKILHQQGVIFQSFFNMITYLEQCKRNYVIILRSFGQDLKAVTEEITQKTGILFEWEGKFVGTSLFIHSHITDEQYVLNDIVSIAAFFKTHKHIYIRDDFAYWNTHYEQAEYGKLFPIDETVQSIFFDDNADESIINARLVPANTFVQTEKIGKSTAICVVDTLQAIENDSYFIDCLHLIGI